MKTGAERSLKLAAPWWRLPGLALSGRTSERSVVSLAMVTATVRHSGDLAADRDLLVKSWGRWMTSLREWLARRHPNAERPSVPYAWALECTDGEIRDGHVHLHVVIPLGWVPYALAIKWWRAATRDDSRLHVSRRWSSKGGGGRVDAAAAAKYLAKYAGKGSNGLSLGVGAAWWCAGYGKPLVGASRGFFDVLPKLPVKCACGCELAAWEPSSSMCRDGERWSALLALAREVGPPEWCTVRSRWLEAWSARPVDVWWPVVERGGCRVDLGVWAVGLTPG